MISLKPSQLVTLGNYFFARIKSNQAFRGNQQAVQWRGQKLGLWLMISAHLTLVIGLYQWFAGPLGLQNITDRGMSEVMKNGYYRFFAVEHMAGMIVAIALITIARGVFRKNLTDGKKHRRCLVLYILSLVIILASIPWPGMEEISRPLFRGF